MGEILFKALVCGAAGLLGWLVCEPSMPTAIGDPRWDIAEQRMILIVSALVGLSVGAFGGWQQGTRSQIAIGAAVGLVLGAIGGTLGHQIGAFIATGLFGKGVFASAGINPFAVLARIVALTPLGLAIGLASAASMPSARRIAAGGIGGALGAGAGAAVFDLAGTAFGGIILSLQGATSGEVGSIPRAIFFTALGLGVGLFTGLIERLSRTAWVRLVLGRNEGKEWSLDSATTLIGRDERAHVPLFGDGNVAPLHASIVRQQGQYWVHDASSPVGIGVNGVRVQAAPLASGDTIQVASHTLQFFLRGGGRRAPVAVEYHAPTAMPAPVAPSQATQAMPAPAAMAPPVAMATRYSLAAIVGPLTGQRFAVDRPIEVGRDQPVIPLSFDTAVSRRHASFEPTARGVRVTDLGSTNGTLVNGQRIQSVDIAVGDRVQIGSTTFEVQANM